MYLITSKWQVGPWEGHPVQLPNCRAFPWRLQKKKKHSRLPSRKLTAKASENWWLEDIGRWSFPFGFRTIFRGELFVFGRVITTSICNQLSVIKKCCNFSQRSPNGCSTPFKESSTKNNHGPTTREAPFQEKIWFLPKMVKIPVEQLFYKQKIHV